MDRRKAMFWMVICLQVLILLGMIVMKQSTLVFGSYVMLKTMPYDPVNLFRGDYLNIRYEISNIDPTKVPGLSAAEVARIKSGDRIYVGLKDNGQYWEAASVGLAPQPEPYISGIVGYTQKRVTLTIDVEGSTKVFDTFDENWQVGQQVLVAYVFDGQNATEEIAWVNRCYQECATQLAEEKRYDTTSTRKIGTITDVAIPATRLENIEYPIQSYFVPKGRGYDSQLQSGNIMVEAALWRGDAVATRVFVDGMPYEFS